ncbi:MAG: hypothetical protein NT045_02405 [Candidatus Aureabacteria bacterium]|nr:hypothetical protein [Candidatus Auribacterota bacterium]
MRKKRSAKKSKKSLKKAAKKGAVKGIKKRARKTLAPRKESAMPVAEAKPVYIAPRRIDIKNAVCALLPHIDPKLIKALDYWALYTIHQDVVKSGKDAEALARTLIRGYNPEKGQGVTSPRAAAGEKTSAATEKDDERAARAEDLARRNEESRKKTVDARDRARAARDRARAAAQAAKVKERAARAAARMKRIAARYRPAAKTTVPVVTSASAKAHAKSAAVNRPAPGAYVPPVRTRIKDELATLMPMIKRSDLTGIDYWALYTMHSEIVKSGRNPEDMARKFVKGYTRRK